MRALVLLMVATALAACSSVDVAGVPNKAGPGSPEAEQTDNQPVTGSRLARQSHDRHVRSAGNASVRADNDIRSIGNAVGTRGN
jgi:hypothetical protein